ncbi:MAG: arylsulfatase [Opitutales bacterium]|jgi:arylsulfatase A-like enzyme|nr:arylsulfatase [Opitutales bacterium]MBT7865247.1 arylsulfatase [Opitutales bacterium]
MMKLKFLICLACSFVLCGQAFAVDRPNVLLILADDLGYSDLGCFGGEIDTPHLDALARDGLRYTSFYNSARCCPSRASLISGLYPHQTGIGSFVRKNKKPPNGFGPAYQGFLNDNCVTIAEVLKGSGYSTWMSGKWHMGSDPGPVERGFDQFFGYTQAHSHSQWDAGFYKRLPGTVKPELNYSEGEFYATDVFTDYALEFLDQARRQEDTPWFLYLAHSSPHFPVQAPAELTDKYMATYRRGWDVLRSERLERMKAMGLVSANTELPPLAMVPVDRDDIANGYSGQSNPAWDSLPANRREDLARRMAIFAASVEHVDRGVGKIVDDLKAKEEFENTLILFTSDNGACYEWGPFGFDGVSRRGVTTLHEGEALRTMGLSESHHSYGSAWANLGNTPLSLYKHFCHEGGISSPLIAHWPDEIDGANAIRTDVSHVMDLMPTILEATGSTYPSHYKSNAVQPMEGVSLLSSFNGKDLGERTIGFEHQFARGWRKGNWKITWGKRMPEEAEWELYDLSVDRIEQNNLAQSYPEMTRALAFEWANWAERLGVQVNSPALKK